MKKHLGRFQTQNGFRSQPRSVKFDQTVQNKESEKAPEILPSIDMRVVQKVATAN